MRNRQRTIVGLLLSLLLVLACQMSFAQGIITGSIAGTVVDSTGAIIPGAKVAAKQVETNVTFNTVTGDSGYFQVSKIPPGQYVITIEANNFRTLKITGTGV